MLYCLIRLAQLKEEVINPRMEMVMDTTQIIKDAFDANPDIRLVLNIAARAHETEARELPREIGVATEVVAIPSNPQCAV